MDRPKIEAAGKMRNLNEALRLVLNTQTRYGRRVTSQSVRLEADKSTRNREILQAFLDEIELERKKQERQLKEAEKRDKPATKIKKNITILERQREILAAMHEQGDRLVHASELAAALALTHGIDEHKLRDHFNVALQLELKGKQPYSGSIDGTLRSVLTKNTLKRVHDALEELAPGEILTGAKLAKKLGANTHQILGATTILDLMGAIQKAPMDTKAHSYAWVHGSKQVPEPTWHTPYLILRDIVQRWQQSQEPAQKIRYMQPDPGTPFSKTITQAERSKDTAASLMTIREVFENLRKTGLIEVHHKKAGSQAYRPTEEAIQWVNRTIQTQTLHPELLTRLLDAHNPEKLPKTEAQLARIGREVRFLIDFKQSGRSLRGAATNARMNPGTAHRLVNGISSYSRSTVKTLLSIASYFRNSGEPDVAQYLEDFAQTKKEGKP